MKIKDFESLELAPTADFHVHLRDGEMMETVVPTIEQGGVDTVYVMPNLTPPLTTVAAVLAYKQRLQALSPSTTFLMTLYLHHSLTPSTIADAAAAGISGVKCYPAGVTTNSSAGFTDLTDFYPVFAAMQQHNLVLNLHGECASTHAHDAAYASDPVTILNAEHKFLPTLAELHARFPRLRIVLEHATTAAAVAAVNACGPNVAGTITAHHLYLTTDDWAGNALHFCKPVAKTPADRIALVRAAVRGRRKFFFGSDSAPHPVAAKAKGAGAAAGVFTQNAATQLVVGAFEDALRQGWVRDEELGKDVLDGFLGGWGRRFYAVPEGTASGKRIVLERQGARIADTIKSKSGAIEVVPFRAGQETWKLSWK